MIGGATAEAEKVFRRSFEMLEEMGDKTMASWAAAELAEALCEQGNFAEAERYAQESKSCAGPDDVDCQIRWRSAHARVLAQRGELEEAERLTREAGELLKTFEDPNLRATGLLAQAAVAAIAGRRDEAASALGGALSCYEAKGNVMGADRAKLLLDELQAAERPQAVG